jgi:hypothetical protein
MVIQFNMQLVFLKETSQLKENKSLNPTDETLSLNISITSSGLYLKMDRYRRNSLISVSNTNHLHSRVQSSLLRYWMGFQYMFIPYSPRSITYTRPQKSHHIDKWKYFGAGYFKRDGLKFPMNCPLDLVISTSYICHECVALSVNNIWIRIRLTTYCSDCTCFAARCRSYAGRLVMCKTDRKHGGGMSQCCWWEVCGQVQIAVLVTISSVFAEETEHVTKKISMWYTLQWNLNLLRGSRLQNVIAYENHFRITKQNDVEMLEDKDFGGDSLWGGTRNDDGIEWMMMKKSATLRSFIPDFCYHWRYNWLWMQLKMLYRVLGISLWRRGESPACEADSLATICEQIVDKVWNPRGLNPMGFNCPSQY